MANTRRTCKECGKSTRVPGDYCPYCGKLRNTSTTSTSTTTEKDEEDSMNENKSSWFTVLILALVLGFVLVLAAMAKDLLVTKQNSTANVSAPAVSVAPAALAAPAAPAATSVPTSDDMALNEKTTTTSLPQPLWDDYHKTGVQISNDQSNTVWYVQSGKEGTMTLKGSVPKGQILVVDAYTMVKSGTEYTGGCLLLLRGPFDLDTYEITITNGAAQLVDTNHVQELLDYNIAVKFARGDWNKDKGQFSYSPWALAHVWVLDYTYNSLVGKLSVENDDYPR